MACGLSANFDLRGCSGCCRARRGNRPAERSPPPPLPPYAEAVAGGAAPAPRLGVRSTATHLARRRACRSAALSGWGMRCLGMPTPIVNRDCHVSGWLGQVDPACCSSRFGFQLFVRITKAVLRRSSAIRSRRARKGVKGALAVLAQLGFRSALTPEHTARVREIARCSIPLSVSS
jgi:hypothetical protein